MTCLKYIGIWNLFMTYPVTRYRIYTGLNLIIFTLKSRMYLVYPYYTSLHTCWV
ncbi:hypothetical protein HanRHA438_Chr15g0699791 [Helianthus annuus]|nr:hypothetical protein HanRHA438_Chr15g0699791 [Helianthus annuus]